MKNTKNKQTETSTTKKVVAASVIALVGLGAGFAISNVTTDPVEVTVEKIVNQTIDASPEQIAAAFAEGASSVEPVTINNTVKVDNGNLELVLQHIYDNDGSVDYLTDDLKDSEVAQIADRVVFINEVKAIAMQVAEDEIADLVDKENVNGTVMDEDDVEKIKVEDEFDKLTVDDVDFDDSDAEILVPVEFEHDDVDYEAVVKVIFKDGEYDDVELESVQEE